MIGSALWFLVLAAAPDAGVRPTRFITAPLEVPEAIEEVQVDEMVDALGVPVKLRAVRSRMKAPELKKHFQKAFSKAGLFVPDDDEVENPGPLPHVTGYDVEAHVSYSVLLQTNLDGTTTVIVGEAYLHAAQPKKSDAFAPMYPGGSAPLVVAMESGKSLSYSAKAPPDQILKFYRETLSASGFKESEPQLFERAGTALKLWLKPRPSGETGVVVLQTSTASAH
jgi:hypothetical protein